MSTPGFTYTVTFLTNTKSGEVDADGNDICTSTPTVVPGCIYAPGTSTEVLGSQDTVTTAPSVYAPTGTVLGAIDQAVIPTVGTFDVDGTPAAWPQNPWGGWQSPNSVEIKLKGWTG